jgi:hypothetical protein
VNPAGRHLTQVQINPALADASERRGSVSAQEPDLRCANLAGADFTQATVDQATFRGVTGVPPWSTYLLFATLLLFLVLVAGMALLVRNSGGGARAMTLGVLGSLVIAFGFHLFGGGYINLAIGSFGTPVVETCGGPQFAVGVDTGFFGVFAGLPVALLGGAIAIGAVTRASGSRRRGW